MAKFDFPSLSPDFSEVSIIAIHSTLTAHLLAFHLDRTFFSEFWLLNEQFEISHQKQIRLHTCFLYKIPESENEVWLVQNYGSNGHLFTKKPTPDFFLVFKGDGHNFLAEEWIKNTKQLTNHMTTWLIDDSLLPKFEWTAWLYKIDNDSEDN